MSLLHEWGALGPGWDFGDPAPDQGVFLEAKAPQMPTLLCPAPPGSSRAACCQKPID